MSAFYHHKFEYMDVFIFDEFIVSQIQEGAHISPKDNAGLRDLIHVYFKNKPVVYISNRHFSYAIDPLVYLGASKIKNLVGIAIITENPLRSSNAHYESKFYNKPFNVFPTLSSAAVWASKIVNLHNRKTSKKKCLTNS